MKDMRPAPTPSQAAGLAPSSSSASSSKDLEIKEMRDEIAILRQHAFGNSTGSSGGEGSQPRGRRQKRGGAPRGASRGKSKDRRKREPSTAPKEEVNPPGSRRIPPGQRCVQKINCPPAEIPGLPRKRQNYGYDELEGHIYDPTEFKEEFLDQLWIDRPPSNWKDFCGATSFPAS